MIEVPITISLSAPPPPPPPPPSAPLPYKILTVPDDGRRYAFIVEDYKTGDNTDWGGLPRSLRKGDGGPLPATVPVDGLFYPLNEQWQRFHYELCREACFGVLSEEQMLFAYRRTFRDAGGWRDRHTYNDVKNDPPHLHTDYILGLNLPPSLTYGDAAQKGLLNSRNIIHVIREDARWIYYETLNHTMYDVPTVGASPVSVNGGTKYLIDPPSVEEVWGKWWLVGWMSQSTSVSIGDREWAHTRWPYFGGYGAPYLVLGRGGVNKVEKYWCVDIKPGEFSPYNP